MTGKSPGLTFLKLGAVVYGSGYTLLAFIRDDFVLRLHWLTEQQALDAALGVAFGPTQSVFAALTHSLPGLRPVGLFVAAFHGGHLGAWTASDKWA